MATVLLAPAVFGRPMAATRDVPADRVKTLRVGYHSSLKDPALLEELKKRARWWIRLAGKLAELAKEVISPTTPGHRADEEPVGKLAALPKVCLTPFLLCIFRNAARLDHSNSLSSRP